MKATNAKANTMVFLLISGVVFIALIGFVNASMMRDIEEMAEVPSKVSAELSPAVSAANKESLPKTSSQLRQIGEDQEFVKTDILGRKVKQKMSSKRRFDSADRRRGKVRMAPLPKNAPLLQ